MATEKEEILLEFKVDQSDLFKEAANSKKALLEVKAAQTELNKEFAAGKISIDNYAKESVRLENQLKKEQTTYNSLTKAINTNSGSLDAQRQKLSALNKERSALDKTTAEGIKQFDRLTKEIKQLNDEIGRHEKKAGDFRRDVGKYKDSITDAASEINIAGTNVGSLTTRLASFANPATAAVGIVSALGAAYARSTIGAKDLEFAQNQLSTSITLVTNSLASLVSSSEDGEGLLSQFTTATIAQLFGATTAGLSKLAALNIEKLEDLGRTELETRDQVNQRLEENQEILTKIQSDQTLYNEKISLTNQIITNLRNNQEELKKVLEDELSILESNLAIDKDNESVQTAILQKKREISNIDRDAEKKVQAIIRLEQNLTEEYNKQASAKAKADATAADINRRISGSSGANLSDVDRVITNEGTVLAEEGSAKAKLRINERLQKDIDKINQKAAKQGRIRKEEEVEAHKAAEKAKLQATADVFGAIAGIFQEGSELQKGFALASIGVDTAEAIASLTAASEGNPANTVTFGAAGIAQFASGLVRIFSNIAAAKNLISAAAGGGDFVTRGPSLLLVGDNPGGVERVTVEPVSGKGKTRVAPGGNMFAMAGGGSLTTFNDGGLLKNSFSQGTDQALVLANAFKNMPRPVVSVQEITKAQSRVSVKETISRV